MSAATRIKSLISKLTPVSVQLARTHRRDVERVRRQVVSELDASSREAPPILVFTMGKVGSRAVCEAIRRSDIGPGRTPYHVHFIEGETRRRYTMRLRRDGYIQSPEAYVGAAIRDWIQSNGIAFPWKVITLVREPVARRISGFFHHPEYHGRETTDAYGRLIPEKVLEFLEASLSQDEAFAYQDTWFDRELKPVFGLDVLELPFDKSAGYARHRSQNADLLVLTQEKVRENLPRLAPEFLGIESFAGIAEVNRRSDTVDAPVYRWVKERLRLPESRLREIYSAAGVTHFYEQETIDGWIDYWSRPR